MQKISSKIKTKQRQFFITMLKEKLIRSIYTRQKGKGQMPSINQKIV